MNDYQDVFRRVEKKYLLDRAQYSDLLAGIRARGFRRDSFGLYAVTNLYYDTADYALIRHSLQKPLYKEKLRLRVYGTAAQPETPSFVEIKKKFDGVVYKRRTSLPLREAVIALQLRHMPEGCGQIGREIDWLMQRRPLQPKALIAYDREAYFSEAEPELRLTFDRSLRFRAEALDLTLGSAGWLLLPADQTLLEVKLPGVMPIWLCRLLQDCRARPVSFSKYGTAYASYLSAPVSEKERKPFACLTAS